MRRQQEIVPIPSKANPPAESLELGFGEVFALLNNNRLVIAGSLLVSLAIGVAYLLIAPPQYTAYALLMIDSRSNVLPSPQMRVTDANGELAYVETQVGVLKSERVARGVISDQRLYERPEFTEKLGFLPQATTPATAQTSADDRVATDTQLALDLVPASAVKEFGRRMSVKRSQSTYIIDIGFTYKDPRIAADIANAIAYAYLADRLKSREQAIRSTSDWLQKTALELRRQTQSAETALDEFRNGNSATGSSRSVLRDLESTVQTYRLISESFHKRFLETSQEQSFSPLDARVVSEAWPPAERSSPKRTLVLAISTAFGLALGFLIALFRGDGRERPVTPNAV